MKQQRRKAGQGPTVNEALRSWTRGVSFTLALGRSQVANLVAAHLSKDLKYHVGRNHRYLKNFIISMQCLEERGLVIAHIWRKWREQDEAGHSALSQRPFGEQWQVTPEGELVIGLLKATGIYDELRAEFAASDAGRLRVTA